jgi:hypothetical protein
MTLRLGVICSNSKASRTGCTLNGEEIHGLIAYARSKFAAEPHPFAPALRPIREALAKLDPKPTPAPLPPRKPYVPSLLLTKKNKRRR